MKAFCLLLCLVLPHDITGNILRGRQFLPIEYQDRIDGVIDQAKTIYKQVPQYLTKNHNRGQENVDNQAEQKLVSSKDYVASNKYQQRLLENQWESSLLPRNTKNDLSSSESSSHESHERQYPALTNYDNAIKKKSIYKNVRNTGLDIELRSEDNTPIFQKSIEWAKRTDSEWDPTDKNIEALYKDAAASISHVKEEDRKRFVQMYESAVQMPYEDSRLNATELMNKYNYDVEEHVIRTDDGYYLTMFRITSKKNMRDVQQRPVVFLMHGLLGSADDWLLMGPEKSLAYLLSDAGYDVWMGNARGSKYARLHASKHEAQPDFWQFSIDEIALNDLPAMIDYVLKTTNQQKMVYVGHSLGNTAFFALASARPEYNDKIVTMYALSPMVYMSNARSPLFRMIAPSSQYYQRLHDQLGHREFKPSQEVINAIGGNIVESSTGVKDLASHINFAITGVNVDNLDPQLVPIIMSHLPAGASTRQMKQYGQTVDADEFRKYNFGAYINEKVYGSEQPPKYKMEQVKAPVVLYYSENDWLSHPKDVKRLENELPNVKESYKVPQKYFNQMDFQFSPRATEMVHKRLISSIQQNTANTY